VGTVGGNVAHADPASDLPTALTALGATFHIKGPRGERQVSVDDFFVDLFQTALREDELLTAITVPLEGDRTASAYVQLENPASGYAIVGAAAQLTVERNRCIEARVAVGGATPTARRCPSVETALTGRVLNDETIAAAAAAVHDDLGQDIMEDLHASAGYRRQMADVMVRRAVARAAART
jgi:carbon-monoxide dehydrogenase medium subunit